MNELEKRVWDSRGYIASKYYQQGYKKDAVEDKTNDCCMFIIERLHHYNPDKGGFVSFLNLSWRAYNYIQKRAQNSKKAQVELVLCEGMVDDRSINSSSLASVCLDDLFSQDVIDRAFEKTLLNNFRESYDDTNKERIERLKQILIEVLISTTEGNTMLSSCEGYEGYSREYIKNIYLYFRKALKEEVYPEQ